MASSRLRSQIFSTLFAAAAVLGGTESASALTITYFDRGDFLSDTGSEAAVPIPNLGLIPGGASASYTLNDLTFSLLGSAYELYLGTGSAEDWTDLVPGNQIAISGPEHLAISMATSLFAFGFDFVEPHVDQSHTNSTIIQDSIFTVSLFDGITLLDSFQFNAPNDVDAFVGFVSTIAFNRVHIVESTETIDNEFFGGFYRPVDRPDTEPVPEPASIALLGSAVIGLAAARRRGRA